MHYDCKIFYVSDVIVWVKVSLGPKYAWGQSECGANNYWGQTGCDPVK